MTMNPSGKPNSVEVNNLELVQDSREVQGKQSLKLLNTEADIIAQEIPKETNKEKINKLKARLSEIHKIQKQADDHYRAVDDSVWGEVGVANGDVNREPKNIEDFKKGASGKMGSKDYIA